MAQDRSNEYTGVYLPKELKDKAKKLAEANKVKGLPEDTLSDVIRLAVIEFLSKRAV